MKVEDGPYTSTFLDDVFYILGEKLNEAVQTLDVDCICGSINISSDIVIKSFFNSRMGTLKDARDQHQIMTIHRIV